jgi:HD-like signal output (HDOD) protein
VRDVLLAEREELNVDHGHAGAWLVGNWALPKDFREVCAFHHDPPGEKDSEIVRLVKISCMAADVIEFTAVRCREHRSYLTAIAALPLRTGRDAVPPPEELRKSVKARLAAFEG